MFTIIQVRGTALQHTAHAYTQAARVHSTKVKKKKNPDEYKIPCINHKQAPHTQQQTGNSSGFNMAVVSLGNITAQQCEPGHKAHRNDVHMYRVCRSTQPH